MYAITVYGRDNKQGAMDYFDVVTRTVVCRIGWFTLCTSEDISIERANFRQIFQTVKKQHMENKQLHPGIRKVIEATKDNNRKAIEMKSQEAKEPQREIISVERSDRIQELINKTKEKLGGSTKD